MIKGFELYTPGAWSDMYGLMVSYKPHNLASHHHQGKLKRSGKWNVIIPTVAGGACLAISALLLSPSYSAVSILKQATDIYDDAVKLKSPQAVALSPIRDINKSFNKFFDSVRTGQMLIPTDNVRLLAQKALQNQKEGVDIDSWARNLANDIKDAND